MWLIETILQTVGCAVIGAVPVLAMAPQLLRWIAAHLLTQAGAVEAAREYRRAQLGRTMEACGVGAITGEDLGVVDE